MVKNLPGNVGHRVWFLVRELRAPQVAQQRRQWHPTPVLLPGKSHGQRSLVGCSPWGRYELDTTKRLHFHFSLSLFTFTFHFHALEKEMVTHSSVLAWRIPGTGEPGGLPSMGSHKVGHDWSDLAAAAASDSVVKNLSASAGDTGDEGFIPGSGKIPWRRKWQPMELPGKFHGQKEPSGLLSMQSQGWTQLSEHACTHRELRSLWPQSN